MSHEEADDEWTPALVLFAHSVDRYVDYRQGGGLFCDCGEFIQGALPHAEHQVDALIEHGFLPANPLTDRKDT